MVAGAAGVFGLIPAAVKLRADTAPRRQLSEPFSYQILATTAEAPLALRMFTTAVKTDSQGKIITGPDTGVAPRRDDESAIVTQLAPGAYTAVMSGKKGGTGTGLVEVYGLR